MSFLTKLANVRWIDPADPKKKRRVPANTPGAVKKPGLTRTYYIVEKHGGKTRRVNTGKTDKRAAEKFYADWITARERGEVGLSDPYRAAKGRPVLDHLDDYLAALRESTRSEAYHREVERVLRKVFAAGRDDRGREVLRPVDRLRDLTDDRVRQYLARMTASAATKNQHRAYISGFLNFLVATGRLPHSPVTRHSVRRAATKGERRRRWLRPEDLRLLVRAARDHPVGSAAVNTGGRPRADGTRPPPRPAALTPEALAELASRGRERWLLYRLAILTGLRRAELSRLRVRHLVLDGRPRVELPGALTKGDRDAVVPLVPALADDLRAWVVDAGRGPDDPVVTVPERHNLLRVHKAHLEMAGLAYRDDRGWAADFRSLRTSTQSYLSNQGVDHRLCQRFLRHVTSDLASTAYHDDRADDLGPMTDALARLDADLCRPPEGPPAGGDAGA
ncbi:MAG: hypothetical protein C0501_30655 [Isosphaera sp.]|nr:hypothetical protein [Isosphaera sp.]